MSCPSLHDLAAVVVGPEPPAELRDHVAGCAACQDRVRRLERSSLASPIRGTTIDLQVPAPPADSRLDAITTQPAATLSSDLGNAPTIAVASDRDGKTEIPLLARGASVGRYLVLELLGAGGMGAVYAAYDPQLDRRVALKILRPGAVDAVRAAQTLLLDEAKAMAKLSHRNVIAVHDVGIVDDRVFIAMELIEGGTLRDWLARAPRRAAVIERMLYAGRGLAAAHDAGLVHRDFKPENVLLGTDGRVCVSDFGIARPEARFSAWIAGTPAYMAPEAARGVVDRRSDQYSFCVTLHEALTGELPAGPGKVSELVPLRLRRLLARGLAAEPDARFPTMAPVLAALGRPPAWRRWVAVGIGVAAISVITAVVAGRLNSAPEPCASGARELASTWGTAAEAAVRHGFAGAPDAQGAVDRAVTELDRWSKGWVATHRGVCRATRVDATQSAQLLDLRMACLRDRAAAVGAVVAQLRAGDRQALSFVPATVEGFGDLRSCSGDRAALLVYASTPGQLGPAIDELRAGLARLEALFASGRYAETVELGAGLAAEAERARSALVIGRAGYFTGVARGQLGDFATAEAVLRGAVRDTDRAGDDEFRIRSQLGRAQVLSAAGRHDDALDELAAAEATVQRGGRRADHQAGVIAQRGQIRFAQGQYDAALADARDALARLTAVGRGDGQGALQCEVSIGTALEAQGHPDQAVVQFRFAAGRYERALGRDAPQRAVPLAFLAGVEASLGDDANALVHLDEAIALFARGLGPSAPQLAMWRGQRAPLRAKAGDVDGARKDIEVALAIVAGVAAPEIHEATLYGARGDIERGAGDQAAAVVAYTEALDRLHRVLGPDHPAQLEYLARRAEAHRLASEWDLAIADFERSLGLARQHHLDPIENEYMLGSAQIDAGRLAAARPHLEACLAAVGPATPAGLTASCQFLLAQAIVATDRRRALELARTAIATSPEGAAEIGAWLATVTPARP